MAIKQNVRRLKLQRRQAVDEIRLRDLNREAHRRATSLSEEHFKLQIQDLLGILPDELPSEKNRRRRVFLGLEERDVQTPRDETILRMKQDITRMKLERLHSHAWVIFRVNTKALFLIQDESGYWYFLYREKGNFYKKSCMYSDRSKAMDRYENENILWLSFYDESTSS